MFTLNGLNLVKTNVRAELITKSRFLSDLNVKNGFTYRFSIRKFYINMKCVLIFKYMYVKI